MYCTNCGREGKEGELFCGGCGAPKGQNVAIQPVQQVPQAVQQITNNSNASKKKGLPTWGKVLLIIGITLLVIVLGVVGIFCFLFFSISNYEDDYVVSEQNDKYVYVDKTEIPTVYKIMGEYEMCNSPSYEYYDGVEYITYSYCDSYFDEYIINEYLDSLISDYDFEEYEVSSGTRSVVIESEDKGYSVVVKAYIYGEYIQYYTIKDDMIDEDNDI